MKKLILAFAFAIFSLGIPVLMAQAVAQQELEVAEQEQTLEQDESAPRFQETKSNIKIDIEGLSEEDAEKVKSTVEDTLGSLASLLGDRVRAELALELGSLSEEEKEKVSEALGSFPNDQNITVNAGNIGFPELAIALTAISLTLGLPVIILVLVLVFGQKKRRQMMELAKMYVDADKAIPPHVLAEFGTNMNSAKRLRTGLTLLFVGLALVAILTASGSDAGLIGLLPAAVGISRIIYWVYEVRQEKNLAESGLAPDQIQGVEA